MAEQHEKTLVPQIRFAGFADPWEQRKLGEVAPLQRGFDLPVSQMISGPYPVVMSNGVGGWHSKYAVKGPGVVTGRSGTIGGLQYIEGDFWPHNTSLWVTSFNGNEPKFIYWLYSSLDLERFGSGSGVPTLNRNDVHDQLIGVPCNIAEQRRIGAFFDRLDSLITLHQRKYDKLCVLKKSMLDKMFPKGGSLYPEIRFAGFADPWEQRKLGELASKRIEKNTNGIKETFTNSAEHGVVSQLDYFDHDITNDANIGNYSVVHPDDFIYNPRISTVAPCGPINRNKLGRNGVMSPLYTVFSVDDTIDKLYLEHYFKTSRWHQFMFLEGNSGARSDRFSISDSIFFEMPIQCPVLEEQELIASFFDRLDSLITLHQRKYDGCANPLFLERRISCRKPSHQNRCSATTTPSG